MVLSAMTTVAMMAVIWQQKCGWHLQISHQCSGHYSGRGSSNGRSMPARSGRALDGVTWQQPALHDSTCMTGCRARSGLPDVPVNVLTGKGCAGARLSCLYVLQSAKLGTCSVCLCLRISSMLAGQRCRGWSATVSCGLRGQLRALHGFVFHRGLSPLRCPLAVVWVVKLCM